MNKHFEAQQFAKGCDRNCYLRAMCFAQDKQTVVDHHNMKNEVELFLKYFEGKKLVFNYDEVMDEEKGLTLCTPEIDFNFEYMHEVTVAFILKQGFKRKKRFFDRIQPQQRCIAYTPSPSVSGAFHFSTFPNFAYCLSWLKQYGLTIKDAEIYVEEPKSERWAIMRRGGVTPILTVESYSEAEKIVAASKYKGLLFIAEVIK